MCYTLRSFPSIQKQPKYYHYSGLVLESRYWNSVEVQAGVRTLFSLALRTALSLGIRNAVASRLFSFHCFHRCNLAQRLPTPRIGLLATGHLMYWGQFPGLKEKGEKMLEVLCQHLQDIGSVIMYKDVVDTPEKAVLAGLKFAEEQLDVLFVFPLGYTTGMVMVPAINLLHVPIRLLNAHIDSTYKCVISLHKQ